MLFGTYEGKKIVYFPLFNIRSKSEWIKSNITLKLLLYPYSFYLSFHFALKSFKIILINLKTLNLSYLFSLYFGGRRFFVRPTSIFFYPFFIFLHFSFYQALIFFSLFIFLPYFFFPLTFFSYHT